MVTYTLGAAIQRKKGNLTRAPKEQKTRPTYWMNPTWTCAKIIDLFSLAQVETRKAIQFIFRQVTMHNIQEYHKASTVRCVNQPLQILWCSKSAANCKRIRHMIPKRSVVSMLLDCHKLDGIVSLPTNSWDDLLCADSTNKSQNVPKTENQNLRPFDGTLRTLTG